MSLPERKHHRLKNYDYSSNGAYFITICSYQKMHIFGYIDNGVMKYSKYGKIACEEIQKTNQIRKNKGIQITKWVIMPNHIHLLFEISHDPLFDSNPQFEAFSKPTKQSIPTIVRAYKSAVTRKIRQTLTERETVFGDDDGHGTPDCGHGTPCPYVVWQDGYFDNTIKNEKMYEKVWQYIDANPLLWNDDCYNE